MKDDDRKEEFNRFGYKHHTPCRVCGNTDTRTEPRFGYAVCIEHFHMTPVELNPYPFT